MVSSTNTYSFKQGHPGFRNSGDSPCYFVHLPKVLMDLTFTSSFYSSHPVVGGGQAKGTTHGWSSGFSNRRSRLPEAHTPVWWHTTELEDTMLWAEGSTRVGTWGKVSLLPAL